MSADTVGGDSPVPSSNGSVPRISGLPGRAMRLGQNIMILAVEPLLVTPSPVDLRLWVQDVALGWKTVAQMQREIDAKPESQIAKRIQAVALVPELVTRLVYELGHVTAGPILLLTCHRAVIVCAQELFKEQKVHALSLYQGTPEKKRNRALTKFAHDAHYPVLLCAWLAVSYLSVDMKQHVVVVDAPEGLEVELGMVGPSARVRVVKAQ